MKLDFNKIIFSIIFSVIPVHIFLNRMQLDIGIMSLLINALVIITFVVIIAEMKNKYVRIATLVLALVCVFIFNDFEGIKYGMDELLDSYGSLVRVKKNGNDILGELVVESEYIGCLIRLYLEIAITCLYFVYGNRLWKIIYIDITIPFVILIFATGITPNTIEICIIIIMYVLLAITTTQKGNTVDISHKYAKQVMVMYGCIITLITLFISNKLINENDYERPIEMTNLKAEINAYVSGEKELSFKNILSDIIDYLDLNLNVDDKSSGGMSDGKLGRVDKVEFSGEKIMEVYVESPTYYKDYYPLYIKYFVGSKYTGNSWEKMDSKDEEKIEEFLNIYDLTYYELERLHVDVMKYSNAFIHTKDEIEKYVVSIFMEDKEVKDNYWVYNTYQKSEYEYDGQRADFVKSYDKLEYLVYGYPSIAKYDDVKAIYKEYGRYPYYDGGRLTGSVATEIEEMMKVLKQYEQVVDEVYTEIPESFEEIANAFRSQEYVFKGRSYTMDRRIYDLSKDMGYEPYIRYVQEFLSKTCTYTLSPGKLGSGEDFVNKFLLETQEGYCTHFASAGVLLFRSLGIPARYVTGYVVHSGDAVGEFGTSVSVVKDDSAHAWVEIYISGIGWRPVEVTPGNYRDVIKEHIGEDSTTERITTTEKDTPEITTEEPTTSKREEPTTTKDKDETKGTTTKGEAGSGDEEITTVIGEIEKDNDSDNNSNDISKVIIWIVIIVVIFICIIGVLNFVIGRRHKKVHSVGKLLMTDRYNKICKVMIQQLLCLADIAKKPINITDSVANTAAIIEQIGCELDEKMCYDVAKVIYKCKYSNDDMNKEEAEQLVNVVQNVTTYQYNNSNILRKTYMSYIKCLYLYKK